MVKAAAEGLIDYTKCDPYSRRWRSRHQLLLRELANRITAEVARADLAYWGSLLGVYNLKSDMLPTIQEYADRARDRFRGHMQPWLADQLEKARRPVSPEEYLAAYEAEYGKEGTPEYQAMIDNTLALLAADAAQS